MSSPQPAVPAPRPGPSVTWSLERDVIAADVMEEIHCLIEVDGGPESDRRLLAYDLALVVDRSGSMGRWALDLARQTLEILLGKLGADDRVALVAYADTAEILVPITGSHDEVLAAARGLEAGGGSDMASGLHLGVDVLRSSIRARGRERRMVPSRTPCRYRGTTTPSRSPKL